MRRVPTLCLGEALVDLVCERPRRRARRGRRLRAAFRRRRRRTSRVHGGARSAPTVALAGGAGDDAWGALAARPARAEGVDLRWFELVDGLATPIALRHRRTTDGEPSYSIYGDGIAATIEARGRARRRGGARPATRCSSAPTRWSGERRARADAWPPASAPSRWTGPWSSTPTCACTAGARRPRPRRRRNACVPGALPRARATATRPRLLTGEPRPERGGRGARWPAGARLVVVTLGADGALLRGRAARPTSRACRRGRVSTVGAGDALMGVLLARLSLAGFSPAGARGRAARRGRRGRARDRALGRGGVSWPWAGRRARPRAGDPRAPARASTACPAAPRTAGRSTSCPHRPVAEHQRPQPRCRLRAAARALPVAGRRCATRPEEEVEEAIRPGGISKVKSARIQAHPARDRATTLDLVWLADVPVEEARAYLCDAARRGPQDRGLRPALLLRPARRAGRHPRGPRRPRGSGSCARDARSEELHDADDWR